ncbi:MAG: hypothetical protein ABII22_04205 [Candidatus Micrarchaeota archaeon]
MKKYGSDRKSMQKEEGDDMVRKLIKKSIPYLFVFFVLSIVFYFFGFGNPSSAPVAKLNDAKSVCTEGAMQNCTYNSCNGYSQCENGKWSYCKMKPVCVPGSKSSCTDNGCVNGYKVCNDCGTDYGDCFETN